MSEYTDNILSILESGPMTVAEITKAVYPDCQPWEFNGRRSTVQHHLYKMLNYHEIHNKQVVIDGRLPVNYYARLDHPIEGKAFIPYKERIMTILADGEPHATKDIAIAMFGAYDVRTKNRTIRALDRLKNAGIVASDYTWTTNMWRLIA